MRNHNTIELIVGVIFALILLFILLKLLNISL